MRLQLLVLVVQHLDCLVFDKGWTFTKQPAPLATMIDNTLGRCLAFFSLAGLIATSTGAEDWAYKGANGPANWQSNYPICGRNQQSPMNIFVGDVVPTTMTPFSFSNYGVAHTATLSNNGHTVVLDLASNPQRTITSGGLIGTFAAAQLHLHWGSSDTTGSEHLVNSVMYPMELHIVHYNMKYNNISEAVDKSDGLAVLGFMFEIGAENPSYTEIVSTLAQIRTEESSATIPNVILNRLIPANTAEFYRYPGSLTTPSCYESVTWTVFKESIKISSAQLAAFRTVLDKMNNPIQDNYRPVQPRFGRVVQASFDPKLKWGYLDNAAASWGMTYEACGGQQQSPVDIEVTTSRLDASIPDFQYYNYDATSGIAMEVSNNGHAAVVTYTAGSISINGGGLGETYTAAQFHLHWGSTIMQGSEHTMDGDAYPAELHIVHYKAALGTLSQAAAQPKGLAVLGFFMEISRTDNEALTPMLNALANVIDPASPAYPVTPAFSLESILPATFNNFYRYDGSLTTPGCYESVVWTVFTETIKISTNQLAILRRLKSSEERNGVKVQLEDNYRPTMPLNTRVIRRNFQSPEVPKLVSSTWAYSGSAGVDFWYQSYPKCANGPGKSQSPVDIKDTSATFQDLTPITLSNYRSTIGIEWQLSNNGHTVTATLVRGDMSISGSGFSDTYKVAQFHLHWGSSSRVGSEHLINSKAYPMELHIVHYGASYKSLSSAVTEPNGLAVLGFMFEISTTDNPNLAALVNGLSMIKYKGNGTTMASFSLRDMLPESLDKFYRYSGSLTTPGCDESVVWTVFTNTIPISESQIQKFRQIMSSDKDPVTKADLPMVNNYRPPQPINGRVVYANFRLDPDAAVSVKASAIVCSICFLFLSLLKV